MPSLLLQARDLTLGVKTRSMQLQYWYGLRVFMFNPYTVVKASQWIICSFYDTQSFFLYFTISWPTTSLRVLWGVPACEFISVLQQSFPTPFGSIWAPVTCVLIPPRLTSKSKEKCNYNMLLCVIVLVSVSLSLSLRGSSPWVLVLSFS